MFGNFTEEARKIMVLSKEEMMNLKHPYVGSEHLLLALLKGKNNVSKKLNSLNITYDKVKKEIIKIIGIGKKESEWFLYTPMLRRIIENSIIDSKDNNDGEVTINHLFVSLLDEGEGVAIRILLGMGINLDNLYKEFSTVKQIKNVCDKKLLIEEYGVNLTDKALKGEIDPVVGRDKEEDRLIEILLRRCKNNPILIGEAGVGKTAIVEGLSNRIVNNDVPRDLFNKKIISVDMASLVAGTKYRGEFEERIRKMLKEIEDDDSIILFIDEIHTIVGAGGAEGAIDASNIFKPSLARGKLRCIGATTINEYKKYIESDSALDRRFQKIVVEPCNEKQTFDILYKLRDVYESFHKVKISDDILNDIIFYANKYIHDRNEPDRSIDILDEVCSKSRLKKTKIDYNIENLRNEINDVIKNKELCLKNDEYDKAKEYKNIENELVNKLNNLEIRRNKNIIRVTKDDVIYVVSSKTKIPIYEVNSYNLKYINEFEKMIRKCVIGQDDVINKILRIVKKIKFCFKNDDKCLSYLFLGNKGVGKTYIADLMGEFLVGKDNVIKLDMREYKDMYSINKIIGDGHNNFNSLTEIIRNKPNSVLIIDDIDKAHISIQNLFLEIIENSKIKDINGKEILFNNVVIIMTSNENSCNSIGFEIGNQSLKNECLNSFINCIDDTIIFKPLNIMDIKLIIDKKIKNIVLRYHSKGINIKYSSILVDEIISKSNFSEYGVKKIDKIINDDVENIIIDEILKNKGNIRGNTICDVCI